MLGRSRQSIKVVQYQLDDYAQALVLLRRPERLHLHLDWHTPEDWLARPDLTAVLAWQGRELVGIMALSPVYDGTSWLRIIALQGGTSIGPAIRALWSFLLPLLRGKHVNRVLVLMTSYWLEAGLASAGFIPIDAIVTMKRPANQVVAVASPGNAKIDLQPVTEAELSTVASIDRAAFAPGWRMLEEDIWTALHDAASFTLAKVDGAAVGYQLTLQHARSMHLARLATAPNWQGQGIGRRLLEYVLLDARERKEDYITVNTTASNQAQHLYQRYGFVSTEDDVPVWECRL